MSAATCTRSTRNRVLSGLALGYAPQGAPDYGLDRARFAASGERYAVLLHATARAGKQWPETNWIALGAMLAARGLDLVLPWGTAAELARSERIAQALPRARVPERSPLDAVAGLIAGAQLVVGVDTGLMHLAAALGVPLVAIFAGSRPGLTGPVGSGPIAVLGAEGRKPDRWRPSTKPLQDLRAELVWPVAGRPAAVYCSGAV